MANVLNPEPESITLNTELEILEPATEQVQPLPESTSKTQTAEAVVAVELPALDADAPTEPQAEAVPVVETTAEAAPAQEIATEVAAQAPPAEVAAPARRRIAMPRRER